jgi:hypothetical protein
VTGSHQVNSEKRRKHEKEIIQKETQNHKNVEPVEELKEKQF